MANKREFKKAVEAIGASAIEPMIEEMSSADENAKAKISEAITKVISAVAAAQSNADITFDKGLKAFENIKEYSKAKSDFYKKLFVKINDDFTQELQNALNLFNSTVPQSVKDDNKESVKS